MAINIISVIRSYQYVAETALPSRGCDELSNLAPSIHPFLAQEQSKYGIAINY